MEQIMDYIEKILPITKVKKEFLDVTKEMVEEESTITVTKNGMPVGVMMTLERYEGLLETIEILADPKVVKALPASERDFRAGKVYTHKGAWAD
jgi:prevent-host-death family protein